MTRFGIHLATSSAPRLQLGARAWQEAAQESLNAASVLFFKQLRLDRVLRPI